MKRGVLVWAGAVLLASCVTMLPPEPGDRALLVISVEQGHTSYGGFPLAYELGLAETGQRIPVNALNRLVVFDGLQPGDYTIDRVYTTAGPEIAGGIYLDSSGPDRIGPWRFTLKRGEITILQVALAVSVSEWGSDAHMQALTPVAADRGRVLQDLARLKHFDAWRIAAETPLDPGALQAPRPRQVQNRMLWFE